MKRTALALIFSLGVTIAHADEFDIVDYDIFRSTDPLAQRDDYGLTHQGRNVNATDFAPRYHWRLCYYFKDREQLILDPAYVGSMQTALKRRGYYCGPVDGVFTPQVSRRHCAPSKKLFHACDRYAHDARAARVTHAVSLAE